MGLIEDLEDVAQQLETIRRNSTIGIRMLRHAQRAVSLDERKAGLADTIRFLQENPVPGVRAPDSLDVPKLLQEADSIKAELEAAREAADGAGGEEPSA